MAEVEIPVTEITRDAGADTSFDPGDLSNFVQADTSNGHFIAANDGDLEIEIYNDDVSSHSISIATNPDNTLVDGLALEPLVLTVAAGTKKNFGPFRPNTFRQDDAGRMEFTASNANLYFRAWKRAQARN